MISSPRTPVIVSTEEKIEQHKMVSSRALRIFFFLLCWASSTASRTRRSSIDDYYYHYGNEGYYFSSGSSSSESRTHGLNGHFGPHDDMGNFNNPWASFFNFSDCRLGQSQKGLREMKQYLANFGYLSSSPSFSDSFDDSFRDAILSYQNFFHLNSTGELDDSTLQKMVEPRCGVPDVTNKTNSSSSSLHGRNLYSFFEGTPSWPRTKSTLTYGFVSTSAVSIDIDVLRTIFSRAFDRWAEVTTLTFSEVDPTLQSPDLKIGFFQGDHGDGEPFDGQLGTLAHAFSPTDGRFHLDATENWVASAEDVASENLLQSALAVDLESVAVHEIGHLLGLGHSEVEDAIMYPTIKTRSRRVQLSEDDILGIQQLYGNNPNYNGTSAYEGGTATNPTAQGGTGSGAGVSSSLPNSPAFFLSPLILLLLLLRLV